MLESDINKIAKQILSSRKNANQISELIDLIKVHSKEDNEVASCAMINAITVFKTLCEKEDILFENPLSATSLSNVMQYKLWVGERFMECYSKMLDCLTKMSDEQMITHIMELLRLKSSFLFSQTLNCKIKVYGQDFSTLLMKLLRSDDPQLIRSFCVYLEYDDVRYIVLNRLPAVLNNLNKSNEINGKVLEHVFLMLKDSATYMPDCEEDEALDNSFLFSENLLKKILKAEKKSNLFSVEVHRKTFGVSWLHFLKQPLPANLHKDVLIILHNLLIPNFAKPRLLADYLARSFHQGGGLALLGLHGLFVLVNEYNLEYPDFYKNLYTLLHPRIFEKKYKNRFFILLKQFLSSTHIPSYIVAAFVKKMSRLSLVAPPAGILVILNIISSLIHTHPSISYLINSGNVTEISVDPFLENEEDLVACKAAKSSLWEVNALEDHYLPEVSKAASIVKKGKVYKHNVDKLLDSGYQELINFDEPNFKSNAMNHVSPIAIIGGYEDISAELWTN